MSIHTMPDTREKWHQQTYKDIVIARGMLGPNPSGPLLSDIQLSENFSLMDQPLKLQLPSSATLTWRLVPG